MSKGSPRRWTAAEDDLLLEGFAAQAAENKNKTINWNELARRIPGRSNKDCRKRYFNHMAGNIKKGTWTDEEDAKLKGYIGEYGLSWAVIAQCMGTRSAEQCSKRWNHCLDPQLERQAWTEEEDLLLLRSVKSHGTSWKDIQTLHFAGRSANNVKNRYTTISRRSMSAPPDAPPCCPHRRQSASTTSEISNSSEDHELSPEGDLAPVDNRLSHSELMDGVLGASSKPLDFGLPQNDLADFSSTDHWGQDIRMDPSGSNEFDALMLLTDPAPTPVGEELAFFPTASSASPPDVFEGLDPDLRNLSSVDFGINFPQQEFNPGTVGSFGPDRAKTSPLTGLNNGSRSARQGVDGSSVTHGGRNPSDSRYTITIDGAELDTVMQVMEILVASRVMVNFQVTSEHMGRAALS